VTGELRVDHGTLDAASTDLADAVRAIDDRLHRLEGELAPLRSDWTGQAQQAYLVAEATWRRAMAEMTAVLARSSVNVSESNIEYRSTDRHAAGTFDE
jgi:ESAT-6 family protein